MSFDTLGLSAELLRAIGEQGYDQPTPIQQKAIPVILSGRDVMAGAQTGTGKTAGFTLPLLQLLSQRAARRGKRPVRALVLTPTRELAAQIGESVSSYGRHLPLRSTVIFGGVKINPQIEQLRRGVDILVATPGRLLDHCSQKTLDLSDIEILVLDEADRMLDMGFIHDIRRVLALLPDASTRQNLLFSATFSEDIKQLAGRLLNDPQLLEVAPRNATADRIAQVVYPVDKSRKRELLSHLIVRQNWQQVLVFTRTKHGANRLVEQLGKDGLTAAAIHGNKSQGARTRVLANFKAGAVRILVATDIAARGLDIDQLPHVVNFELPNVPEDYVHRIGRTARAGRSGEAVSLVAAEERKLLRDIERLLKRELQRSILPGFEPTENDDVPLLDTSGRGQRQSRRQGGKPATGNRRHAQAGNSTNDNTHRRRPSGNSPGSNTRSRTQSGNSTNGNTHSRAQPGNSANGNTHSRAQSSNSTSNNTHRRAQSGNSGNGNTHSRAQSGNSGNGNTHSRAQSGNSGNGNTHSRAQSGNSGNSNTHSRAQSGNSGNSNTHSRAQSGNSGNGNTRSRAQSGNSGNGNTGRRSKQAV